jgi:hypothetical protein
MSPRVALHAVAALRQGFPVLCERRAIVGSEVDQGTRVVEDEHGADGVRAFAVRRSHAARVELTPAKRQVEQAPRGEETSVVEQGDGLAAHHLRPFDGHNGHERQQPDPHAGVRLAVGVQAVNGEPPAGRLHPEVASRRVVEVVLLGRERHPGRRGRAPDASGRARAEALHLRRGAARSSATAARIDTAAASQITPIGREMGIFSCARDASPKALAKPITWMRACTAISAEKAMRMGMSSFHRPAWKACPTKRVSFRPSSVVVLPASAQTLDEGAQLRQNRCRALHLIDPSTADSERSNSWVLWWASSNRRVPFGDGPT